MSANHADHYAQLAREAIAEAKAKLQAAEQPGSPPPDDDVSEHAQAARAALRGTTEGDADE